MSDRILTLHPQGKQGVNIERAKYEQIRSAICETLQERGEIPFSELTEAVQERLHGIFEGKIVWYVVTVKLDLEARGEIERVRGKSPQRVRLGTPHVVPARRWPGSTRASGQQVEYGSRLRHGPMSGRSRQFELCRKPCAFPGEIAPLREFDPTNAGTKDARGHLREDGYILLRQFLPREAVLRARDAILAAARPELDRGATPDTKALAGMPVVRAVLEHAGLFAFFEKLFSQPALTYDHKWLRLVQPGEYSGIHYDSVYMGRGSDRVHTVWTPLDDIPVELGSLAICRGSHKAPFEKLLRTYGRMDVDRDEIRGHGWYSEDPDEVVQKFGGTWQTADFSAGDVIIFSMHTLHCSTRNLTDRVRLSCDSRFQPAGEPADARWTGPNASGHSLLGRQSAKAPDMAAAKKEWGV